MKIPTIPGPGLFPTGDYKKDGLSLFAKLIRTKNVEGMDGEISLKIRTEIKSDKKLKLKKCLTTLDLTSLGVGSCVGTGMYLVSGMVARNYAGPGVIVSFFIAALASIFSGACYAEFGVRVPHTTGSAYMYSYVTVGEFIAFVIGWNMILEYLIGTSACACALSACFDALTSGAISKTVASVTGTIFGRPPDFLASIITVLMTILIAAGVKKSLVFNNVLNAINLAAWVFIMSAGLFYVNTDNWSQHKGFLPYGWSGVFTGAATCFYAFIGFDIIATTGEEANNPKKSIPLAIVSSLVIILMAYVTSSMMLTLIVPYEEVDQDSGLVEMFGQVGAYKCQYIVAIGALAGLTVSMFGSMFPMPRVVYAMAQDGLIFRSLGQVLPFTGTPVFATFCSGAAAAIAALLIKLEVLVEMMSIGTLLAYTLVSTCVLILRYQPHTTNLMDLLPESLRTPLNRSPSKENVGNGQAGKYGTTLPADNMKTSYSGVISQQPPVTTLNNQQHRVMVRKVTRSSSPDSDDTYAGEESEDLSMRDDQFLVSDRNENKFYGSVHAGSTQASAGIKPRFSYISHRLQAATYLCPAIFPWVDTGPATEESGMMVMKYVLLLYILIILFDLLIVCAMDSMGTFLKLVLYILFASIIAVLALISRKPQNRKALLFMTPCVPFVPGIAVAVNIYLIFKLSVLTLVRFTVWMTIGFGVYFYYGIKHSSLEHEPDDEDGLRGAEGGQQNIEMKPPLSKATSPARQPVSAPHKQEVKPEPPARPPTSRAPPLSQRSESLFVPPTEFPTWDD
ncbi:LOW QUALITY PROTEIN: solute carrier family 7 member 14 [Bemisia tabaci]|uniref:LOW QUALITY PROTEIN: solute carrier family 7 member 14 n=1 Tax=Bemisia tabaci TaxID=7038 RepID=UPI0008F9D5F1|nr:PREDICTED: probable cationic amino acid transporter isoform X2 [Bemisia tabaci]